MLSPPPSNQTRTHKQTGLSSVRADCDDYDDDDDVDNCDLDETKLPSVRGTHSRTLPPRAAIPVLQLRHWLRSQDRPVHLA